jgi:hypothetical protein
LLYGSARLFFRVTVLESQPLHEPLSATWTTPVSSAKPLYSISPGGSDVSARSTQPPASERNTPPSS